MADYSPSLASIPWVGPTCCAAPGCCPAPCREHDCLRGTGLTLGHLCDFLQCQRWAEVEERRDGVWVTHLHLPR